VPHLLKDNQVLSQKLVIPIKLKLIQLELSQDQVKNLRLVLIGNKFGHFYQIKQLKIIQYSPLNN
jgi:hypothetical protein